MPEFFKLLARNLVIGALAGWITLAGLIVSNVAGLGDIIRASNHPLLPVVILAFGFFITFGSLAMGAAIMLLPRDHDRGKGSGLRVHTLLAGLQILWSRRKADPKPVAVPVGNDHRY